MLLYRVLMINDNEAALLRYEREQERIELAIEFEENAFIQNTEDLFAELFDLVEHIRYYQTELVTDQFVIDCIEEQL